MSLKQNVAGTWKDIVVWQNVLGTWKKIALHQNVAGVWKQITTLLSSTMSAVSGNDFKISPGNAACTLTLSNAGTWTCVGGGSGTWRGGGTSSEYDCRMTLVSGSLTSGTTGSWLNLASSQSWSRNESRDGFYTSTFTGTLEIRMAASPFTVLSSTSVYLEASVEV